MSCPPERAPTPNCRARCPSGASSAHALGRPVAHGNQTAGRARGIARRPGWRRRGARRTAQRRRRAAEDPRLRRRTSLDRGRRPRRRRGCRDRPRRRDRGPVPRAPDRGHRRGSRRPGAPRRGRPPAHQTGTAGRGLAARVRCRVVVLPRAPRTPTATWVSIHGETRAGPTGTVRAMPPRSRSPTRSAPYRASLGCV